jgi:hypothetical protein
MKSRVGGVVLLILGAFIAYVAIDVPIHDASAHAARVETNIKGALFAPMVLLLGIGGVVQGRRFFDALQTPDPRRPGRGSLTRFGWMFVIVAVVAGGLTYFGLQTYLSSLGYRDA